MGAEVILAICKRLLSQSVNNTGLRDASASKNTLYVKMVIKYRNNIPQV